MIKTITAVKDDIKKTNKTQEAHGMTIITKILTKGIGGFYKMEGIIMMRKVI